MRVLASLTCSLTAAVVLSADVIQSVPPDIDKFLRAAGKFSEADLASLAAGHVVAHVEKGTTDSEVLAVAAVKIFSPRERTAKYYGQFTAYVDGQVTLGFGRFSRPAVLADVKDLALDRDEIETLRSCRPGDCDLRLPATALETLRSRVDWKAPDVEARVNALVRQAAVDYVNAYLTRGDEALVTYGDRPDPLSLKEQWWGLLAASKGFYQYSPALAGYLGNFPKAQLAGARDVLYWIRENYGRKPVLSLVHAVAYDAPERPDVTSIVQKQLYASHYYEGSLAIAAIAGATEGGRPVSYVVYGNRSRGDLLKGGFGGLRQSVASDQARKAAEQTLTTMKTALEKPSGDRPIG
jgi:hypothetical protein